MGKREMDLLEEYIADGNKEARKNAELAELCDLIDEIRALHPPPTAPGLIEQTVERMAEKISVRQANHKFYRSWLKTTGWASAAVAAVLLVTMGVLPYPSKQLSTLPAPPAPQAIPVHPAPAQSSVPSGQEAAAASDQILSAQPAPQGASPGGENSPAQSPPQTASPGGENSPAESPAQGASPGGENSPAPPAPQATPSPAAGSPAQAKPSDAPKPPPTATPDAEYRHDRPGTAENFKMQRMEMAEARKNYLAMDQAYYLKSKDRATGGASAAPKRLSDESWAAIQDKIPFKVLTVPELSPVRVEINEKLPGVTMTYKDGEHEIIVRQWLQDATDAGRAAETSDQAVRLLRGNIVIEVSGNADRAVLEEFACRLR